MKDIFEEIRRLALPYQDKRDDAGHAAVTQEYAARLLKLEDGDEDVVIPAIILHDIGYSQMSRERRMLIFDKKATAEDKRLMRIEHQDEGVKLAGEILKKVGYPEDLTEEILEIISQHDTRKGFISRNEGLVRDADKLWRFTGTAFKASRAGNRVSLQERLQDLEKAIDRPGYIYSGAARKIARQELEARRLCK